MDMIPKNSARDGEGKGKEGGNISSTRHHHHHQEEGHGGIFFQIRQSGQISHTTLLNQEAFLLIFILFIAFHIVSS